ILRWVSTYGSAEDRRYIAVWHENPLFAKWAYFTVSTEDYPSYFEGWSNVPQMRPICISSAVDGTITAVFSDEGIGPYDADHNLTSAAYQAEFNTRTAEGFLPIMVQGGNGFTAIFAKQERANARSFNATGQAAPELAGIDQTFQVFMEAHAIRAA